MKTSIMKFLKTSVKCNFILFLLINLTGINTIYAQANSQSGNSQTGCTIPLPNGADWCWSNNAVRDNLIIRTAFTDRNVGIGIEVPQSIFHAQLPNPLFDLGAFPLGSFNQLGLFNVGPNDNGQNHGASGFITISGARREAGVDASYISLSNFDDNQLTILNTPGETGELARIAAGLETGIDHTGNLRFYTNQGYNLLERMRIDANGRVGIGIQTPQANLDVNGTARIRFTNPTVDNLMNFIVANAQGDLHSRSFASLNQEFNKNNWSLTGNSTTDPNTNFIGTTDMAGIGFRTNNNEHLRIDGSGNVGIGTSNPNSKLEVVSPDVEADNNKHFFFNAPHYDGFNDADVFVINSGRADAFTAGDLFRVQNSANNPNKFVIKGTGNIGIGTPTPTFALDIQRDNDAALNIKANGHNGPGTTGHAYALIDRSGSAADATILFRTNSTLNHIIGTTALGSDTLQIGGSSKSTPAMQISSSGNIQINSYNTNSKPFTVFDKSLMNEVFQVMGDGRVYATEVNVRTPADFPDYVFEKDYNLMSIGDLEKYISKNKHLPEIPSAKEVSENGINVAEMQQNLLKKVEELTLYVIELQKRINELEK